MTSEPAVIARQIGKLATAGAALLIVISLVLLPVAAYSMWTDLIKEGEPDQYDMLSGELVTFGDDDIAQVDVSYLNVVVTGVDAATRLATLAISGSHACAPPCPSLTLALTFFSLGDARRRGLPPSVTLDLTPDEGVQVFNDAIQLPVRGNPSLYPFDDYQLWLGVVATATLPDGTVVVITREDIEDQAVLTLQSTVSDLNMSAPVPIDPGDVRAVTDPFDFLAVQRLAFERPVYQHVLAMLLVLLISTSAGLALVMRTINELLLGIGGLILGIWGVRSVVVPAPPSDVNVVDLALALVILALLLALSVRVARHVRRLTRPADAGAAAAAGESAMTAGAGQKE